MSERPSFPPTPDGRRRALLRGGGFALVLVVALLVLSTGGGAGGTVPFPVTLGVVLVILFGGGALALAYSARSRRFRAEVERRSGAGTVVVSVPSPEMDAALALIGRGALDGLFAVAISDEGIELWRPQTTEPTILAPWSELESAHPGTATSPGSRSAVPALWLRWHRPERVVDLPLVAPRRPDEAQRLLDAVAGHLPIV